jgi:hypothetical protein
VRKEGEGEERREIVASRIPVLEPVSICQVLILGQGENNGRKMYGIQQYRDGK